MVKEKLLRKKILYPLIILLLITAVFLLPALSRKEVNMAVVERGAVREYVFEDETQTRLDVIRTVSAPLSGTLRRIEQETGDFVEAGQVISTIEDDEILHAIAAARAQVDELEAKIRDLSTQVPKHAELEAAAEAVKAAEEAEKKAELQQEKAARQLQFQTSHYGRIRGLHDKNVASQEQYDLAELEWELARKNFAVHERHSQLAGIKTRIAGLERDALEESLGDTRYLEKAYQAGIEQIKAELETLHYRAGKTNVKSPVSGVVTEKHLDSESVVQAGEPLLVIGDLDSIEIKTDILSADISLVEPGQRVVIEGDILGDRELLGTVRRIYPHGFTKISALGIEQQRFRTIVDFDNSEAKLPPGADLDVRIIIKERENTLYLPAAAVFMTVDGAAVFRVEEGRARITQVETGLAGDERIEVVSGLEEGDNVVMRPPPELEHNDRVRLK